MAELRRCALTGAEVIVAEERQAVPRAPTPARAIADSLPGLVGSCPFCPGHESATEATIDQVGEGDDWRVRVVTNKFPVVRPDPAAPIAPALPALGAQEVVIEHTQHSIEWWEFSRAHMQDLLMLLARRVRALETDAPHVALFKNRGRSAGGSQPHPHSQVVALPTSGTYWRDRMRLGTHLHESVLALAHRERSDGRRVVQQTESFVALSPYASLSKHAVWVIPNVTVGFGDLSLKLAHELASILPSLVGATLRASGKTDYNLVVRMPPTGTRGGGFHIEILPRAGMGAGLERSVGLTVLSVSPEATALRVRELLAAPTER